MLTLLACYPPTRRHAVLSPAGGQQQLRGTIGSKVLCALMATTPPLLLCIRRALLLSRLPPLSLVGHSSSAHYPLPVTMVFGPSSGVRRRRGAWRGLTLEVNRGYTIPYYISRARAGRPLTAGLAGKKGPDRAISGSSEHLISLLSLKKDPICPHFGPLFVPFLHPIIVGMWRTCTWCACPHVSPSKGG